MLASGEVELHFPKFENEESMTESEICIACNGCCSYVTAPLEPPRSKAQKDMYTWYLLHRNVEIYIDHDKEWQLLFKTPCDKLKANGFCGIYETRPKICRDYTPDGCSRAGKDYIELFKNPEELNAYLESRKRKKSPARKTASKQLSPSI